MSNSDPAFPTPDAAETAFYTAFADCDVQAMDKVWANGDVICIHPGSSTLVGHDAVMRSWMHILTNAEPPNLHIEVLYRYVSSNLALHVVEEQIMPDFGKPESTSIVLATNVYHRDTDGWRMLEHHASVSSISRQQHTIQ